MKNILISSENIHFNKISNILRLRKNSSILVILGANTQKLSLSLGEHFSSKDNFVEYIPKSDNIILDIVENKNKNNKIYIINLYKNNNINQIQKNLQFSRDYIAECKLKIIFIFDNDSYENLIENNFDFFSVNNYFYNFNDHSYSFDKAQVNNNNKIDELIKKYQTYTTMNINPKSNIKLEMLLKIAEEAQRINNTEMAINYYEKSLSIIKIEDISYEISGILINIGVIYYNQGDLLQALKYYNESLKISKRINNNSAIALSLGNIALIYKEQGDLKKALKYYTKSLEINKKLRIDDAI